MNKFVEWLSINIIMGAHKTPLDVWAAPNQGEEGLQMPGLTPRVKCEFKPNHKLIKIIPELYFIIMGELWRVRLLTNNIAARSEVVVGLHKTPVRCVFCLLCYFILFYFRFVFVCNRVEAISILVIMPQTPGNAARPTTFV